MYISPIPFDRKMPKSQGQCPRELLLSQLEATKQPMYIKNVIQTYPNSQIYLFIQKNKATRVLLLSKVTNREIEIARDIYHVPNLSIQKT